MVAREPDRWIRGALWGLLIAVAGYAVATVVGIALDVIRDAESDVIEHELRIRALELEHEPHRAHMTGRSVPVPDHPGRAP